MEYAGPFTEGEGDGVSRYLVAGCTPWAKRIFDTTLSKLPGEWEYVEAPDALESCVPDAMSSRGYTLSPPDYIFFLHWRWKVPPEIVNKYPCIGFHLGKLPHEGGGSPLQWRILEGQRDACLTEFRMTENMDEGPTLNERTVSLHGSAEEIYARAMREAADMIHWRISNPPAPPLPVMGERKFYPRRKPEDSRIPTGGHVLLSDVYDWIRCVDADGYPRAFLEYGGLRFEFERAVLYDGRIKADVTITEIPV